MASLGDLTVNLAMDTRDFSRGTMEVRGGLTQVAGQTGRTRQAVQQLTFAVEDAAVSFSTGGLAGALRASSNNLAMVAMMMGGLKAQIIATAVIVGTQLISAFMKAASTADHFKDALKGVRDEAEKMRDAMKRVAERQDLGLETDKLNRGPVRNVEDLNKQRERNEEELQKKRRELIAKQAERDLTTDRATGLQAEIDRGRRLNMGEMFGVDTTKGLREEWHKLQDRGMELGDEMLHLKRQISELEKQNKQAIPKAFERSQEAEAAQQRIGDVPLPGLAGQNKAMRGLQDELERAVATPLQQRIMDAAKEFEERMKMIQESNLSGEDKARLQGLAEDAAVKAAQGPAEKEPEIASGALKGSREAIERIQKAQLQTTEKGDKRREELLKQIRDEVKKRRDEAVVVVGAFG